jgi:hypothetical protein
MSLTTSWDNAPYLVFGVRRTPEEKLHDLCANRRSEIAEEGFRYFAALYELESEARELRLDAAGRQQRPQATLETHRGSLEAMADPAARSGPGRLRTSVSAYSTRNAKLSVMRSEFSCMSG